MPRHNTNSRPPRQSSSANHKSNKKLTPAGIDPHAFTTKSILRNVSNLVTLDGRTLEGGGQLVRVALTLSALLSIPVRIHDIRGGRAGRNQSGGLKESHLAALEFLRHACGAKVFGGEVGSSEVIFLPGQEKKVDSGGRSQHKIELKNPGSVWLIFQALYPFLVFRGSGSEEPTVLQMKGGTNVSKSMSAEYVQQVFLPNVERIGLPNCEVEINKRGWTHGSRTEIGEVEIKILPLLAGATLPGFGIGKDVKLGEVKKITISVLATPTEVLGHLIQETQARVKEKFPGVQDVEVVVEEDSGDPRRIYLLLVAHSSNGWKMGRDCLWEEKMKKNDLLRSGLNAAERMAKKVTADLAHEVEEGGFVDEFMQDQLVVFQALATGVSTVNAADGKEEGTEHTKTVRWVLEEMLADKVTIRESSVLGCDLVASSGVSVAKEKLLDAGFDANDPGDAELEFGEHHRPAIPDTDVESNANALAKGVEQLSLDVNGEAG